MKSSHSKFFHPQQLQGSRLFSDGLKRRGAEFYTIGPGESSINCHTCGYTSYNPEHVRQKYCPCCLTFHEDRMLMLRLAEGYQTEFHSRSEVESRIKAAA
jgi:hypothetical protein